MDGLLPSTLLQSLMNLRLLDIQPGPHLMLSVCDRVPSRDVFVTVLVPVHEQPLFDSHFLQNVSRQLYFLRQRQDATLFAALFSILIGDL